MKFRTDFVTNSSSSSFVFWGFYSREVLDYLIELVRNGHIYIREDGTSPIDPKTLSGYLLSEYFLAESVKEGRMNELSFFPRHHCWDDPDALIQKTGFEISETGVTNDDPIKALLSFIWLDDLPEEEAQTIIEKLSDLVHEAKRNGEILRSRRMAMTDSIINQGFDEGDRYKTVFKTEKSRDHTILIGCKNKQVSTIECESCSLPIIGDSAIENMTNLKLAIMNAGYQKIGEKAFSGCSSLVTVRNRKMLDFERDRSIVAAEYPDFSYIQCESIEKNAFSGCMSLKAVIFGLIKKIGSSAFEGCEGMEALEINWPSVKQIESRAFSDCSGLKNVYFPDDPWNSDNIIKPLKIKDFSQADCGIKNISPTAFRNCENVLFHVFEGTYAHKYAMERGIKFILNNRFPCEYNVEDITPRRDKNAEGLSSGDYVLLQPLENPFAYTVQTTNGREIGRIYESRVAFTKYLRGHLDSITATVKEYTPSSELQRMFPDRVWKHARILIELNENV